MRTRRAKRIGRWRVAAVRHREGEYPRFGCGLLWWPLPYYMRHRGVRGVWVCWGSRRRHAEVLRD